MVKFVVDTTSWSIYFRRKTLSEKEKNVWSSLDYLISAEKSVMLGAVRQELLSGISDKVCFDKLKQKIQIFEDYIPQTSDYELAAEFSNICRKNGIQGSTTDYLICAVAAKNNWVIFSQDGDFQNYKKLLPVKVL